MCFLYARYCGILVAMRFSKKMLKSIHSLTIDFIIGVGVFLTINCDGDTRSQDPIPSVPAVELHQSSMMGSPEKKSDEKAVEDGAPVVFNPYAEWRSWCEPVVREFCKEDADCAGIEHPSKKDLKCVHPWFAKNKDYRICAAGFSHRNEREWRRNRLREIVRQNYFDEVKHCKNDGRPIHKEHWRCQVEWKKAERLTKFLWLVYRRETSGRPWKRHRLEADASANKTSWYKQANRYGWDIDTNKWGDVKRIEKLSDRSNPYYSQMHRWKYGLGPYGHNAALFAAVWDLYAPPEILCREVEPTEVYLRRARKVVRDLNSGIDCDGDRKRDYWDKDPTLTVVHLGASGGKLCPKDTKSRKRHEENFRKRAHRAELDPDEVWTLDMLGRPMEPQTQNIQAAQIYDILEREYPSPS